MSCATTWTTLDVAALEKALADGVRVVEYSDKKVEYRSLDEMFQLLATMKKAVCGDADATNARFYKTFATHSKGLD